jgi:D-alanyl-D-alanine carboxypeptidase
MSIVNARSIAVRQNASREDVLARQSKARPHTDGGSGTRRPHLGRAVVSIVLLLGMAGAVSGCGDDDEPTSSLHADLQATLDDVVARGVTPGVALVVSSRNGQSWSGAAGLSDVERKVPMSAQDSFRAGSILKTLVATAVLQSVERRVLALDDTLTERLPASVTAHIANAESITLAMLLSHRSGIPEWVTDETTQAILSNPEHVWTLDEILGIVEAQPPVFAPGASYGYSNTNYVLLGEVLSAAEGRSWREVVRERVIARAGLSHTRLPEPGNTDCLASCARGYVPFEDELMDFTDVDPSMAGASGGHALVTTAFDLTSFWKQLRAGALFERADTLDAMLSFQPAPEPESRLVGYGLGVMRLESQGTVAVGHLGTTAGYQSFMLYVPETDRYVTGFTNVMGDLAAVLVPILDRASRP